MSNDPLNSSIPHAKPIFLRSGIQTWLVLLTVSVAWFEGLVQGVDSAEPGDLGARFCNLRDDDDHRTGAILHSIRRGGPAAAAGLANGDVIRLINGRLVTNAYSGYGALAHLPVGTQVDVWFERNGALHDVDVTLGKRDLDDAFRKALLRSAFTSRGRFTVKAQGFKPVGTGTSLFTPAFEQTSTGTLTLELDRQRTEPFISVYEATKLDGTLTINLGQYVPQAGDSFEIVGNAYFFATGEFTTVNLPKVGPGLQWQIIFDDVASGRDYDRDGLNDVTLLVANAKQP